MNLLREIQSDLVNETASLANTLRKAKILANQIELPELREWVDFELSGYHNVENVPEYRQISSIPVCTVTNGRMILKKTPLPLVNLPDHVKDIADQFYFLWGVRQLESMMPGESLNMPWPQELLTVVREHVKWEGGGVIISVSTPISTHSVQGVLDQIKNRLLDFVLGLQEHNIIPENMKNQTEAKETVRNTFNTYIIGDQNNVASGENVNQTIRKIQKGDSESLLNFLRKLNLGDDDIREVEEAISIEPTATNGQFGPRVRGCLEGMMKRIASIAVTIGSNASANILTQAFQDFYGIGPQR